MKPEKYTTEALSLAPIVRLRLIQRVRKTITPSGIPLMLVVEERYQARRADSDAWEEIDIVVEVEDDNPGRSDTKSVCSVG